ncbi:hypothetical protein AB6E88_05835 [Providencia hangzhouensis]
MRVQLYPVKSNGGLDEGIKDAPDSLLTGYANLVSSPPFRLASLGGDP